MIQGKSVEINENYLQIEVMDGRIISIPLSWYTPLVLASSEQREQFRFIARNTMIEWEDLDLHLDIEEMFRVNLEQAA
ncbi:DUF2442 domain-containing protein [Synechococcus sp. PCC 6312]|uniref:DUF2442 domain-containing protein n=1 Tax=Synechococcus sp. (strain ATCC 27167 / PCC 6312) TaxID=195253 RepID=UPI00029F236B|nr:DUF2442 domain-containing protein [Synechococcus sp. PCC 6312]AFY62539.1 Protein of unknown function (DUF3532) [Synechococcus sp. PCC 6312]